MLQKLIKVFVITIIIGPSFLLFCPAAKSAEFVKKPVRLIVTAGPGGGEDTDGRALAPLLEKQLGIKVLIDSQPSVGGKVAFEKFQKTVPDGYSLILFNFPKSIIIEYMDNVNYRTKDFTPIYAWASLNPFIVVNADTWKSLDEFIKAAKAKTLSGGLSGRGGVTHVAGLVAIDELGIKVNWVPYEGVSGSTMALAGKHLDFTVTLTDGSIPLIRAGKLRALACLMDKRDPYLPDVPTAKELGYNIKPLIAIRCAMAPPKTPINIVKTWEKAFSKVVREAAYIDYAKNRKLDLHYISAQEFGTVVSQTYPTVEKFQHMFKD